MLFMNVMPKQKGGLAWKSSGLLLIGAPLAIFIGIVSIQIFGPVPIGLADNNDFSRVLGPFRLWPAPPYRNDPRIQFRYFVNDYVVADPRYDIGVPSSERLVAALAKRLARWFLPAGTFRLSLMGLIHAAILTFALFIFVRAFRTRGWRMRAAAAALLLFVWTDVEYIQELNTAYTDAGAVVTLAVVFSLAVQSVLAPDGCRWPWALLFGACSSFLLATKTQHDTALPFLAAFCFWAATRSGSRRDRIAWAAMPVLLTGVVGYMLEKTPANYRLAPAFSIVFYKLSVLSPDPAGVLREFQLPPDEFGKYVGHFAYEPIVPGNDLTFAQKILDHVTAASLASFYMRHPGLFAKVLLSDLRDSAPYVNLDLTNEIYGRRREIDIQRGKRPFKLDVWSGLRRSLFRAAPFHLIYLFGIAIVLSGICLLKRNLGNLVPLWPVILLSALLAMPSFLFASTMDATETARHLVFFQAATDLTIVSLVLSILLIVDASAP